MSSKTHLVFFEDLAINCCNKIIFLDIDGTLLPDSECLLSDRIVEAINTLAKNNEIHLCTNSRNHGRNKKIEKQLHLKIINLEHKKPNFKILQTVCLNSNKQFVVIGDKFLTDFLFAKNIKADFLMVRRKLSRKESTKIKFYNTIDDICYYLFRAFTKLWIAVGLSKKKSD